MDLVRETATLVSKLVAGHFDNGVSLARLVVNSSGLRVRRATSWSSWVVLWMYRYGRFASQGSRRPGVRTKSSVDCPKTEAWRQRRSTGGRWHSRRATFISDESKQTEGEGGRQIVGWSVVLLLLQSRWVG